MINLSNVGRIFYGVAMAGIGLMAICYKDFPYMLIPASHTWIPGIAVFANIFGAMLMLAGAAIVFKIKARPIALLLGSMLLLIFCFYFIPYQFTATTTYMQFGAWENAAKELALSSGAFVIAGCFEEKNENGFTRFLAKLVHLGTILFGITITSFGIDHFLYAKEALGYMPSWVPVPLFWMYFTGTALLGSGIAIILKIKVPLIAALLGAMIFTWFVILHIPKVMAANFDDAGGEVTSAFLALAYSGIAFVIAGGAKNQRSTQSRLV